MFIQNVDIYRRFYTESKLRTTKPTLVCLCAIRHRSCQRGEPPSMLYGARSVSSCWKEELFYVPVNGEPRAFVLIPPTISTNTPFSVSYTNFASSQHSSQIHSGEKKMYGFLSMVSQAVFSLKIIQLNLFTVFLKPPMRATCPHFITPAIFRKENET